MKKRVLIVSVEFPPMCGGAGRVGFDTAKRISRAGIDVDIITLSGALHVEGCNFYEVKKIPFLFPLQFILKVRQLLKLNEYASVILNDIGAALAVCLMKNSKLDRKAILYLHGNEPEKIIEKPKWKFRLFNFTKRYTQLLCLCKKVVCVSEYLKTKILSSVPELQEKNVLVIRNTCDKTKFYPEYFNIREKYGIAQNTCIMFSASRIVEGKGYPEMYQMFKQLIFEGESYIWLIAGEGQFLPRLRQMAKKDGLLDKMIFLGNLETEDLRKYYSSVDVFVLLSNYYEAFGLVYSEAISCGTPVIAKNIGGVQEAVKHGENGFLVENTQMCYEILKKKKFQEIKMCQYEQLLEIESNEQKKIIELL